jgi:hypothetical protein
VSIVDRDRSEHIFRPERHLFVAQQHEDRSLIYSPAGPLTRYELDLAMHFDTLSVAGLLPGRAVAVGDTWQIANPVAQMLCSFEGLTEQKLLCKLEEIKDQVARVSVSGSATGIDLGALVKLNIEGIFYFDLSHQRLTRLEWKQKEEHDQGPASPAASVQSATIMTRTPIEQPQSLSEGALVSVPDGFKPQPPLTYLEYCDAKSRFKMVYDRDWQTVSQSEDHVVMRLMEQGDFVAQVTITPWTKAEKGKHLSAEEFTQAMAETPGWQPEQELQAGEVPAEGGRWIYRISAAGKLDGNSVNQNFYLVAGPSGEQVVLMFTMTQKQTDRLAARDLAMAANLEFPARANDDKPDK